ncbi:M14 family metallopeptidase [Hyphomicrobiales bacterium]|jgi:predicted deacylase|nr:M14 family metallopeptidase [Hyphomicrobiales bacterium]
MKRILFFIIFFLSNPLHAENPVLNKQCLTSIVLVDFDFPGAGNLSCEIINSQHIKLFINSETDDSINPSPWFAIRKSKHSENIKIELDYGNYNYRYNPKISSDNKAWDNLNMLNILKKNNDKILVIDFLPSNKKQYIASQEIITQSWYYNWFNELKETGKVRSETIGFSVLKKPITMFFIETDIKNPYIIILGRQHPPEVTGAFALKGFIDQLVSPSQLSQNFLNQYNIIFVPLMNPDGVDNGHWRYNVNKIDLNRDWGTFSQPETIAVNEKLIRLTANSKLALFIDFHSTYNNIFYISENSSNNLSKFSLENWINNSSSGLFGIGYNFQLINSSNKDNGVSKNYIYNKYNIPSMTYEVSDSEDRKKIKQSSSILATELMKFLVIN